MAQSGNDIADNLKDSFSKVISAPVRAMGSLGGTIRHALGGDPAPVDTSWHDQQVKEANASHAAAVKPAGGPKKPAGTMPKYHKGTDYVPKTGPAILKKGEVVLDPKESQEHREMKKHGMESVASELGGKAEKPKKEIKHIKTEKAKSGGYIHTHVHTHPEAHPDEQHVTPDQDGMMAHMMEHMGTPNPGEAEADAGQSGVPAAGAPPVAAPPAAGM